MDRTNYIKVAVQESTKGKHPIIRKSRCITLEDTTFREVYKLVLKALMKEASK